MSIRTQYTAIKLYILAMVALVVLSGCSFITIHNASDTEARVFVNMPDTIRHQTRLLLPGESVELLSTHGGPYSVGVVHEEQYRQELQQLRAEITQRLFTEQGSMSEEELHYVSDVLHDTHRKMKELVPADARCAANISDGTSKTVRVEQYIQGDQWELVCP